MSDIVVLLIDELRSSSSSSSSCSISICRICHEEEFESCKNLEAPCACSGTVKFAHRDCIQRWCNEKGNTICELCLQKFEPGYTVPPKKIEKIDTTVIIREIPARETEEEILETQYSESESAAAADTTSVSCCRLVALFLTALLLMRHLFIVVNGGPEVYPFSLITVLIAKATGVIVPVYILLRIIEAIHNNVRHRYQNLNADLSSDNDGDYDEDEEWTSEVDMHP